MAQQSYVPLFSKASLDGALFCSAIGIFYTATVWIMDKINDQDEDIEELFSGLEDCEEKIDKAQES